MVGKQKAFEELFDEATQAFFYVGVCRNFDIRTFNVLTTAPVETLVGITNIVDYIEIENSVDFSFRVGRIGIRDNIDARKVLPLIGNELLYIEYNSAREANSTIAVNKKGYFKVMNIEDNSTLQQKNQGNRHIDRHLTLTIAEYPYVDILTFNYSHKTFAWGGGSVAIKPFGSKPISLLVNDFLTEQTDPRSLTKMGINVFSLPTSDVLPWYWMNYYSPNWSKIKNINFLKRFASSLIGGHSYYFLNCEGSNVTFKSIYFEYLFPSRTLQSIDLVSREQLNLFPYDITPNNIANILMDVKYKVGGGLNSLFGGLSGETNFLFDYYSGHVFSAYDYRLFKQQTSSNDLFYINFQKNNDQNSSLKSCPFTEPFLVQNMKKYEISKRNFNSMVCEATAFVTSSRYLGQTTNILIGPSGVYSKDLIDPVFGENWCIWGYKDIISNNRAICKLTLKKDSTWVNNFGIFGTMFSFT
jgi:hypothetical protein